MSKQHRIFSNLAKSLGGMLPKLTREAMRQRGFHDYRLFNDWPSVIGETYAAHTHPLKLTFDPGKTTDGVLHLQVSPAHALELQYMTPQLLDRLATFFGYRAITRITLHQTHRAWRPEPKEPEAPAASTQDLSATLAPVTDEALKQSLESLGRAILTNR